MNYLPMLVRLATRFVAVGALFFAVFFANGCVTYELWSPKSLHYSNISGTVPLTAGAGSTRALVVEYEFSNERSVVIVPLNPDGSPQPPFAFQGKNSEAQGYGSKAPDRQRAAILQAASAHASAPAASTTPIISDPNCYRGQTEYFFELDRQRDGLLAIAYAIDEKGRIVGIRSVNDPPKLPDGIAIVATHIAVVPSDQPRSKAGRDYDRSVAILLTPFTVVLDSALYATLVPLAAVGIPLTILTGGMH